MGSILGYIKMFNRRYIVVVDPNTSNITLRHLQSVLLTDDDYGDDWYSIEAANTIQFTDDIGRNFVSADSTQCGTFMTLVTRPNKGIKTVMVIPNGISSLDDDLLSFYIRSCCEQISSCITHAGIAVMKKYIAQ